MRRKSSERPTTEDEISAKDINIMNYEEHERLTTGRRAKKVSNWIKLAIGVTCGLVVLLLVYGIASSSSSRSDNESEPLINNLMSFGSKTTASGPFNATSLIVVGDTGVKIGSLKLSQETQISPVTIDGEISGLSPNAQHGFHIHTYGDLRQGCNSTGTHFNPFGANHGSPTDQIRHVGDLGNIETDSSGVAKVHIVDNLISIAPGVTSIIGRAFVVHSGVDDLGKGGMPDSLTTGNAGTKYGCGVIGIGAPT